MAEAGEFSEGIAFNVQAQRWSRNAIEQGLLFEGSALSTVLSGEQWVSTGVGDLSYFSTNENPDAFVDHIHFEDLPVPIRDTEKDISLATASALIEMARGKNVGFERPGFIVPDTGRLTGWELEERYRDQQYWKTAGCNFDLADLQTISALRALASKIQNVTVPPETSPETLVLPVTLYDGITPDLYDYYTNVTELTGGFVMTEIFSVEDVPSTMRMRREAMEADHVPVIGKYSVEISSIAEL